MNTTFAVCRAIDGSGDAAFALLARLNDLGAHWKLSGEQKRVRTMRRIIVENSGANEQPV